MLGCVLTGLVRRRVWLSLFPLVFLAAGCGSPVSSSPERTVKDTGEPKPATELAVPEAAVAASSSQANSFVEVERQPFVSQTRRLIEAMSFAGAPFSAEELAELEAAMADDQAEQCVHRIQRVLNDRSLINVHINPEARVKLKRGTGTAELQQSGWRTFLVRVRNEARVTARLSVHSNNSQPTMDFGREETISPQQVIDRWMLAQMVDRKPLNPELSGLPLEYRILTVFSRDAGDREGHFSFEIGHGTQDIGFRNDLHVLFRCQPAVEVVFDIQDHDGSPATGSLLIQDEDGRLYPLPARRTPPDFFFQEQIYRASGESVTLPAGNYEIEYGRGPEYLTQTMRVTVPETDTFRVAIPLTRWVHPAAKGWISGDHHIHASGCSHYQSPTVGVLPPVMLRHIDGEGLNIGNVLTWGPGWEFQKQNFCGLPDAVSTDRNVIRYDVEVSQFPSDHTGHLCLLNLKEDDYPGTQQKSDWPSWGLPIVQWAKSQGGVTGVAHSGWGLDVAPEQRVPNYVIPPMNGIGAQEFLVHAVHDAVDFISTVDTPYVWELNVWYHLLNCGFDIKASGETDFPCIYDERVGLGRSYVKLPDGAKTDYSEWVRGVAAGRSYVSDGASHLMDFQVEGVAPGGPENSIVDVSGPQTVRVTATVVARLDETPQTIAWASAGRDTTGKPKKTSAGRRESLIRDLPYTQKPYWHLERARVDDTRQVPVEVIVNGQVAGRTLIMADGSEAPVSFDVEIERSSWVALRILAASHTNPVTVRVNQEPVRASRLSAEWCRDGVDQVWLQKAMNIRSEERAAARLAYQTARDAFDQLIGECYDDTASLGGEDLAKRTRQHHDIRDNVEMLEFALASNDGEYGKVTFDRTILGFAGDLPLAMSAEPAHATIHYTLDGSRVTASSAVYTGPVILTDTTTVTARGFIDGKPCTRERTATFTQFSATDFGVNVEAGDRQPGLTYRQYLGDYLTLDDVQDADLSAEYIAPNFTLDVRSQDHFFALDFEGLIEVPVDGVYGFSTTSNDGSRLYIGDRLIVDNDGPHGMRTASGMLPLKAGLHPIRVTYFNSGGGWGLEVKWKGPGFADQLIPDGVLHRPPLASLER